MKSWYGDSDPVTLEEIRQIHGMCFAASAVTGVVLPIDAGFAAHSGV